MDSGLSNGECCLFIEQLVAEQWKVFLSIKDAAANVKGVKVLLRDLDDVLFRDVGGKIAEDGRYK